MYCPKVRASVALERTLMPPSECSISRRLDGREGSRSNGALEAFPGRVIDRRPGRSASQADQNQNAVQWDRVGTG